MSTQLLEHAAEIQLDRLSVVLNQTRILTDISCTLGAGQITAILGPSGCGKSTLLRVVAGLISPTEGSIVFRSDDQIAQHVEAGELGFVFQDPSLLPWRSALANVCLPIELSEKQLRSPASGNRQEVAKTLLRQVQLIDDDWEKLPSELSGGMRMRVSLARALATDPSILLLDEPFSALDELLRRRLGALLLELWKLRPRTVVLVTHNIDEALLMADKIIVMGAGRIARTFENPIERFTSDSPRRQPQFAEMFDTISEALESAAP